MKIDTHKSFTILNNIYQDKEFPLREALTNNVIERIFKQLNDLVEVSQKNGKDSHQLGSYENKSNIYSDVMDLLNKLITIANEQELPPFIKLKMQDDCSPYRLYKNTQFITDIWFNNDKLTITFVESGLKNNRREEIYPDWKSFNDRVIELKTLLPLKG